MIYALTKNDVPFSDRKNIAQAIEDVDQGVIKKHVDEGTITHVMAAHNAPLYCIFCGDDVLPTDIRAPRGRTAQSNWHFQHRRKNNCIGEDSGELGIVNPRKHGCYIALGCETDENGNHTERHRQECNCKTYCHLASNINERLSPAALLEAAITDFSPCLAAPSQT